MERHLGDCDHTRASFAAAGCKSSTGPTSVCFRFQIQLPSITSLKKADYERNALPGNHWEGQASALIPAFLPWLFMLIIDW